MNFREFIKNEENTVGKHNDTSLGAYLSSDWTGSEQSYTLGKEGHPLFLPSHDLGLPRVIKTGVIRNLILNKNPIFISLTDGTTLNLSRGEFQRIKGERPEVGKTLTVTFQRLDSDNSKTPSKIDFIKCY